MLGFDVEAIVKPFVDQTEAMVGKLDEIIGLLVEISEKLDRTDS